MNRIFKAYEGRYRQRLQTAGARRLAQGVAWLVHRARVMAQQRGIPLAIALDQVERRLPLLSWAHAPLPENSDAPRHFLCDAGLGGLARWLRAAGHKADWIAGIDDDALLEEAIRIQAIVLTTDSLLMERRVVVQGEIAAYWLSPALTIEQQLSSVFREFRLARLEPCCMQCGGELHPVEKEAVRDLIPPRTLLWLDEYFRCRQCEKLFWHGTHWRRIQDNLRKVL